MTTEAGSILSSDEAPAATMEEKVAAVDEGSAVSADQVVTDTTQAEIDWRASLEEEFSQDPSLAAFKNVNDLAKSYINTKKMIGADKISVPGKYATPEEMREVYQKLGLPGELGAYELNPTEGDLNDDLFGGFKEAAFEAGVLPGQAQGIYDWFQKASASMQEQQMAQQQAQVDANISELKQEWGPAFNDKLVLAKAGVKHFGGDDLMAHLDQSGLGNDAKVIKAFAKVGESLNEDEFKGVTEARGGMTPRDIEGKKAELFNDPAYFDKNHPKHKVIVDEMLRLNRLMAQE
jgi:hypothetical protein